MSDTIDRTPPSNVGAEQIVLGAMMIDGDALADVLEILQPRDYYKPIHSTIHKAITALYDKGEPTGPVAVTTQLLATGDIARIGGANYIHECVNAVPVTASATWHARQVREAAGRRRLIEAGTTAIRVATNPEVELPQAIDQAGMALLDATAEHAGGDEEDLAEGLDALHAEILELAGRDAGLDGVATGFADLDRLLAGLKGGQLIVVAGRPGMGKSTLAVDIARNAVVRQGHISAFFSLEMSAKELRRRVLSAEARIPLHALKTGNLDDDSKIKLAQRVRDLGAIQGFKIYDLPGATVTDIRARARRIAQRGPLDLIAVDYLQLMNHAGAKRDNRQQEVADISRGLKLLAKELDVPVIAVAQLNRGPEQRTDKRPMLSDLRESGALEQDADIVIMVHRDDYYDKESPRAGEADLIVAKHRDGETDTVTVAAQLHFSRFVDMAII